MIYLPELVKMAPQEMTIVLKERLPPYIISPCTVKIFYTAEPLDDNYVINLQVQGNLHLECQRCLDNFDYEYKNLTHLAICKSDKHAEKLLERYETIVAETLTISLQDMIIDELYLYAPQSHTNHSECNQEVNLILAKSKSD